jgi:hypothetical protein
MEDITSYSGNKWAEELQSYYIRYIKKDIRQVYIKRIIQKVKVLGFSDRTQKITLELLNHIFKSAIAKLKL